MEKKCEISVDLRQMVVAIETAVDLVGMNDTNHGKRVGYIALQIANHLGFSENIKLFIFELGLLHDCGVSSDSVHTHLVNQFDWEDTQKHCDIGYNLLKDFHPLEQLAVPILYHHTPWEELKHLDIPFTDKRLANLIFVADRVDVNAAAHYGRDILLHTANIKEMMINKSDTFFDPELVEGFIEISRPEAFWISLEDRHISRFAWDMGTRGYSKALSMEDLKQLAKIFSYIVDQKSPFTAQHSFCVAKLAKFLANKFSLTKEEIDQVEVAGYLHDVGKLHVPDSILNKPGPLTAFERSVISQHSYETYEILRQINGLESIAKWAAYHHENCMETGYPFHPPLTELSIPARIVGVSDIFQALVQDRPYRKGMGTKKVINILHKMSEEGKLDSSIVEMVTIYAKECYEIAKGDGSAGCRQLL